MRTALAILALAVSTPPAAAAGIRHDVSKPRAAIELTPGDDIQAAVDAHPQGTSFFLDAGLYRIQSVTAKEDDAFTGADGAILDGALLLTRFTRDHHLWVARDVPIDPNTMVHGECRKGYPRCDHPQDLYFDGVPLRAVAKRNKVEAGTFWYDYAHDAVYFGSDPTGHTVELSYRPFAIGSGANGVTVQNLVVENYANVDQQGAIGGQGAG